MFSRRLFAAGVGMVSAVLAIGFSISAARAACNPSTQEIADCMPQGSPRSATRAPSRNGGSASRRGGGGGGGGAANIAGAAGNIAAGISNLIEGARVCPALARANEDSHAIDARHHALWRQYFGDENYAWQYTREDCAKIRQIAQIEIPLRQRGASLRKAAEAQCGSIQWGGGFPPEKFVADFQEANRRCLPILQASGKAAAPAGSRCPGDAARYVKIIHKQRSSYTVVNTCAERGVNYTLKTGAVCSLGTENTRGSVDAAGRAPVESLCNVFPEVLHATFSSTTAR